MRQSGSSIVEVVVMMFIISISIVGVYSMIHNAQKLAKTTDDRLIATNLAKEALESIGALRDSFVLRAYDAKNCFFTIDISNLDNTKCYRESKTTQIDYILLDDKTLKPISSTTSLPVCINTAGWYSQEWSATNVACGDAPICGSRWQKACRTRFSRDILFESCGSQPLSECVKAIALVTWWKNTDGTAKESLSLEQIFTRH